MAGSLDSVGRAHPLLVWRCVDARWLDARAVPGLPWWHAQAQLLERLFHMARALEAEDQSAEFVWNWVRLCDLAAQLDAAPPDDASALQAWLMHRLALPQETVATASAIPPASHGLHGVRHLPWAQWPEGEHAAARHAAFWQQDGDGGIVAAASTLAGIFRSGTRGT